MIYARGGRVFLIQCLAVTLPLSAVIKARTRAQPSVHPLEHPTTRENPMSRENPVARENIVTRENLMTVGNPMTRENPVTRDNPMTRRMETYINAYKCIQNTHKLI